MVVCLVFYGVRLLLFLYLRYRYILEVHLSPVRSCFSYRRSVLPKVVGDGYVSRLLWCVVALFSSIFGTVTFLRYFQVLLGPISKYKRCVVLCLFPGLNRPNPVAC